MALIWNKPANGRRTPDLRFVTDQRRLYHNVVFFAKNRITHGLKEMDNEKRFISILFSIIKTTVSPHILPREGRKKIMFELIQYLKKMYKVCCNVVAVCGR